MRCTFAPATAIFLPTRIAPLSIARASGGSTVALSLYHPSVTSSSGQAAMANPSLVTPLSDQKIFEMQRTMGLLAGESWVVIKRRAGLEPPFSSFSYLLAQNMCMSGSGSSILLESGAGEGQTGISADASLRPRTTSSHPYLARAPGPNTPYRRVSKE